MTEPADATVRAPKISVIVPTFRPGGGLQRVIASLDAQTLPASDFEVVFVDDGSSDDAPGDDTLDRLRSVAAARANVRVVSIPNSGWPSRPRNIGLNEAGGDYVLFMDHDDELYPDALRAAYELAVRANADVVAGKESRTDQAKWALEVFTETTQNAVGRSDVHPLVPTNPHKLYRRAFLLEHDIRFPEGGRVLWEDVTFNLAVARHAAVVSLLSDVPFYHWVRRETTSSSSFADNQADYWSSLRRVFDETAELLSGEDQRAQREQLLLYQYRLRVLPVISRTLFLRDRLEVETALRTARAIQSDHLPPGFDAALPHRLAIRAVLLREGADALLQRFAVADSGLIGISTATDSRFDGSALRVTATTRWSLGEDPLPLTERNGRLYRVLDEEVAAAIPPELLDVTDEVAAGGTRIGVRHRRSAVTWLAPTTSRVTPTTTEDGTVTVRGDAEAVIAPERVPLAGRLGDGVWDLNARAELFGVINQRGLRAALTPWAALHAGRAVVAYSNDNGMLSLDLGQDKRTLLGSGRGRDAAARVTPRRVRRPLLEIPMGRLHLAADAVEPVDVLFGEAISTPGVLRLVDGTAQVTATVTAAPGHYPLALRWRDRIVRTRLRLEVISRTEAHVTVAAGE